ncbi:MAG: hypothetical protein SCH12_06000 [Nitrosomonadaceae bacterium]|nr:hypothetical protein [Nitrosomonadaceae bacterium]
MQTTTIFCASYGASGVWAFSAELVKACAPKRMLERSEYSSGQVWEANLSDLQGALWAFSALQAPLAPIVGCYR